MRLVAAVVLSLALVGCTGGGGEPSPSPVETTVESPSVSPSVSPSPSPSPTPSPSQSPTPTPTEFESYPADLPTEDPETAAIIEGWQEYQRVREKYLSDPNGYSDFTETQIVTTGEEQNGILDSVQMYREMEIRSLGGLTFDSMTVGDPTPTGENGQPQVVLSYCIDRSQAKVEYLDGSEFPTDQLQPRFIERTTMEQGLDGIWRVAMIRNNSEETC